VAVAIDGLAAGSKPIFVASAVLEVAGARRAVPMGCAGVTTSVPQMPQAFTVTRTQ
jgi:hypothetical protein